MMRRSVLFLFLVLSVLSGCSFKKLAFRHADLIAYYEANEAFDLTGVQKKQLHPEIDKTIEWIRQDPLPQAVDDLERFAKDGEDGLTEAEVDHFLRRFEELRKHVLTRVVKAGVPTLVTLSKEQIDHLATEMKENNEDLEELVALKDEDFTKRSKKMLKRQLAFYEDFVGELTPAQEDLIRNTLALTPETAVKALDARRESQQSFIELLREEKDSGKLEATLLRWVEKPELMGSPVVRENRERRQAAHRSLLLALDQTLTPEQRLHVRKSWSEQIENLREEIHRK